MNANFTIPERVLDWQFGGKPGNLRAQNKYSTDNNGNGYSMLNRTINQYATYGKQTFGLNGKYITPDQHKKRPEHKWHFRLPDGKERDILSGETAAIALGGGDAFLGWCNRDFGINLCWSAKPVFQWRIFGLKKGEPISIGSWVAILNEKVEPKPDFLIYFDRPPGHWDIGWPSSTDWQKKAVDWIKDGSKDALVAYLLS